jgi:SAM-dependent methyltransferase
MGLRLEDLKKTYEESLKKYGDTPKGVGWKSKIDQHLRFQKLLTVVYDKYEKFSLNDLGCSYGELFLYCIENGYNISDYYGYDLSDKILKVAKKNLDYPNVNLIESDSITKVSDYSIESGIFNVNYKHSEEDWIHYIQDKLYEMNSHSIKGFSFNCLTTYVDYRDLNLFYGCPHHFFSFCMDHFSHSVNLLHDYGLHEWTIVVKK